MMTTSVSAPVVDSDGHVLEPADTWLKYPHIDASFGVVRELKEHLAPLPEEVRRKVLGLNAQRFYHLAG